MRWLLVLAVVAPQMFAHCTYSLSKTQFAEIASSVTGSITDTLAVAAPAGCAWTAASNATWLHISFGQSGAGNGSVGFSVDPEHLSQPARGADRQLAESAWRDDRAQVASSFSKSPTIARATG